MALLLKAIAASINIGSVWIIYFIEGNQWANSYYYLLSLATIIATVSRLGYDLRIAYSDYSKFKLVEINFFNISTAIFISFIFLFIARYFEIINNIDIFSLVSISLITINAVMEGVIRSNSNSNLAQFIVLCANSTLLVTSALIIKTKPELMVAIVITLLMIVYYVYIKTQKIKIKYIFKVEIIWRDSLSISHALHGIINQNYITFFITKYLENIQLAVILTIIRILNLAAWPISYYTFSKISDKSKDKEQFNKKYGNIVNLISILSLFCIAAYLTLFGFTDYIYVSAILSLGLLVSAKYGMGFFYKSASNRYKKILHIQICVWVATYCFATFDLLSISSLAAIYATYLIICSFSYRLFR